MILQQQAQPMQLEHREDSHDECAAEQPVDALLQSPSMTTEGSGSPVMPSAAFLSCSSASVQAHNASAGAAAAFEGQQRLQFGSFDDSIPFVPQAPVSSGAPGTSNPPMMSGDAWCLLFSALVSVNFVQYSTVLHADGCVAS